MDLDEGFTKIGDVFAELFYEKREKEDYTKSRAYYLLALTYNNKYFKAYEGLLKVSNSDEKKRLIYKAKFHLNKDEINELERISLFLDEYSKGRSKE